MPASFLDWICLLEDILGRMGDLGKHMYTKIRVHSARERKYRTPFDSTKHKKCMAGVVNECCGEK